MRLWKRFGVATGQSEYPTPIGHFSIVTMQRHPWWYPPDSDWAEGEEPIPPGPGNPLGTRWMGLSASGVGMHGTPDPASIGYSASHGCIRMRISEAEWLFNRVRVGSPVFIVRA
jgi:L,D-transpeptidase ErfK/SrfK